MNEVTNLVERYLRWLRDKTAIRQIKEWFEITTPFLDRHNDYIQIFAKRENDGFVLTDDGYTLNDLEISGCSIDTPKRQELFQTVLNGFGVQFQEGALVVHATPETFAIRKHNLLQAILSINDMFFTAAPTVQSLFFEDVARWLDLSEVRYLPKVKFSGKTGFDHVFDFAIPRSRSAPERLIRAISNPTRDRAEGFVFAWFDTKEARPPNSQAIAVLNDSERAIPKQVRDALRSYDIRPVPWSEREQVRASLAA